MSETKKHFLRGNLGKLCPCLSLLLDGQSTDDNLIRKDKGEEMKPRSRSSKADGSTDRKKMEGHCSIGQSPPLAVVPMEEEEEEEEEEEKEEEEEEDDDDDDDDDAISQQTGQGFQWS